MQNYSIVQSTNNKPKKILQLGENTMDIEIQITNTNIYISLEFRIGFMHIYNYIYMS